MSINNSSLGLGFNYNNRFYNFQGQQGLQQGPPPPPPMFLNGQQNGLFNQRFDNAQNIGFQGLNFGGQNQFGNRFLGIQGPGSLEQGFGRFQGIDGQGEGPRMFIQRLDPAQMFTKLDADSNGTVSEEEFNNLPAPPGGRGPTAEMRAERWAQIDANQDGSTTQEEFLQAGPPPRPQGIYGFQSRGFGLGTDNQQGTSGIDIQSLLSSLMSTFQSQLSTQ